MKTSKILNEIFLCSRRFLLSLSQSEIRLDDTYETHSDRLLKKPLKIPIRILKES